MYKSALPLLLFYILACGSCSSVPNIPENSPQPPVEDYVIDDVEELTFLEPQKETAEDDAAGASFVIHVSSDSYQIKQYRYYGTLTAISEKRRERRFMSQLARYDRRDLTRKARLLISISPNSGRMTGYRLVSSSYVREFDSLIMNDIGHVTFKVKGRKAPSVIYISYVIHLYDKR